WQANLQGVFHLRCDRVRRSAREKRESVHICTRKSPSPSVNFLDITSVSFRQYLRAPVSLRLLPRRSTRPVTLDSTFLSLPHCVWLGPAPYRDITRIWRREVFRERFPGIAEWRDQSPFAHRKRVPARSKLMDHPELLAALLSQGRMRRHALSYR